jgi:uncharacterized coiled-coil protein SlyX
MGNDSDNPLFFIAVLPGGNDYIIVMQSVVPAEFDVINPFDNGENDPAGARFGRYVEINDEFVFLADDPNDPEYLESEWLVFAGFMNILGAAGTLTSGAVIGPEGQVYLVFEADDGTIYSTREHVAGTTYVPGTWSWSFVENNEYGLEAISGESMTVNLWWNPAPSVAWMFAPFYVGNFDITEDYLEDEGVFRLIAGMQPYVISFDSFAKYYWSEVEMEQITTAGIQAQIESDLLLWPFFDGNSIIDIVDTAGNNIFDYIMPVFYTLGGVRIDALARDVAPAGYYIIRVGLNADVVEDAGHDWTELQELLDFFNGLYFDDAEAFVVSFGDNVPLFDEEDVYISGGFRIVQLPVNIAIVENLTKTQYSWLHEFDGWYYELTLGALVTPNVFFDTGIFAFAADQFERTSARDYFTADEVKLVLELVVDVEKAEDAGLNVPNHGLVDEDSPANTWSWIVFAAADEANADFVKNFNYNVTREGIYTVVTNETLALAWLNPEPLGMFDYGATKEDILDLSTLRIDDFAMRFTINTLYDWMGIPLEDTQEDIDADGEDFDENTPFLAAWAADAPTGAVDIFEAVVSGIGLVITVNGLPNNVRIYATDGNAITEMFPAAMNSREERYWHFGLRPIDVTLVRNPDAAVIPTGPSIMVSPTDILYWWFDGNRAAWEADEAPRILGGMAAILVGIDWRGVNVFLLDPQNADSILANISDWEGLAGILADKLSLFNYNIDIVEIEDRLDEINRLKAKLDALLADFENSWPFDIADFDALIALILGYDYIEWFGSWVEGDFETGSLIDGESITLTNIIDELFRRIDVTNDIIDTLDTTLRGLITDTNTRITDLINGTIADHGTRITALETWRTGAMQDWMNGEAQRISDAITAALLMPGEDGGTIHDFVLALQTQFNALALEYSLRVELIDAQLQDALSRLAMLEGLISPTTDGLVDLLNDRIDDLLANSETIDGITAAVAALEGNITLILADLEELRTALNDLTEGLEDVIDARIAEFKEEFLKEILEDIDADIKEIQTTMGGLSADVANLMDRMKALEDADFAKQIAALAIAGNTTQEALDDLIKAVEALAGRVTALEDDVKGLRALIEGFGEGSVPSTIALILVAVLGIGVIFLFIRKK